MTQNTASGKFEDDAPIRLMDIGKDISTKNALNSI
jgi:hypothetical protein